MKRLRPVNVVFCLVMLFVLVLEVGAQGQGPVLRVLGETLPGPAAEILV